ncbi:unnamed protein product, partial [Choristocarpus tenellus]
MGCVSSKASIDSPRQLGAPGLPECTELPGLEQENEDKVANVENQTSLSSPTFGSGSTLSANIHRTERAIESYESIALQISEMAQSSRSSITGSVLATLKSVSSSVGSARVNRERLVILLCHCKDTAQEFLKTEALSSSKSSSGTVADTSEASSVSITSWPPALALAEELTAEMIRIFSFATACSPAGILRSLCEGHGLPAAGCCACSQNFDTMLEGKKASEGGGVRRGCASFHATIGGNKQWFVDRATRLTCLAQEARRGNPSI